MIPLPNRHRPFILPSMCPVVSGGIILEQQDSFLSVGWLGWFTISCFGAEMSPHAILGIRPAGLVVARVHPVGHEWLADGRAGPSCIIGWDKDTSS